MAEVVTRETQVVSRAPGANSSTQVSSSTAHREPHETAAYFVYFLLGLLEMLLAFRLVLRLTGANPGAGFVSFIYSITQPFIYPFEGIFSRFTTPGVESTAVFEPSTIIAMIVYALVAWGIIYLISLFSGRPQEV